MHVFACGMPEMHPKIVLWGYRVRKFHTLMMRPLGNQSRAKHIIWCKNDGDISLCLSQCSTVVRNAVVRAV